MILLSTSLKFDFSMIIIVIILSLISITAFYFGGKTIIRFNKFIQLELLEDELKYLTIGRGKGAGLNYFISPVYQSIQYSNIKFIEITHSNFFEKGIRILQNNGSEIIIVLLDKNENDLKQIISEIKKRRC